MRAVRHSTTPTLISGRDVLARRAQTGPVPRISRCTGVLELPPLRRHCAILLRNITTTGIQRTSIRGRSSHDSVLGRLNGPNGLAIFNQGADRNGESGGNVEKPFIQQTTLPTFHLHQHVPGYTRGEGDLLLGEAAFQTNGSDAGADNGSDRRPLGGALGLVVTGVCRHAP